MARHEEEEGSISTHRCRIFRTHPPDKFHKKGVFSRLWDTLEVQAEMCYPMPPGEVVLAYSHTDRQRVVEQVRWYIADQNIHCGNWLMKLGIVDTLEVVPLSRINRCRLFELLSRPGEEKPRYVEVWDTLGVPYENGRALPRGRLVAQTQNLSVKRVRRRIHRVWEQLGIVGYGNGPTLGCLCGFLRADYVVGVV